MLQKLFIQNYALIDRLEMDFSKKLNIITGETGAGKSIIIGAFSLILGRRANIAALKNQQGKCIVEGTFDVKHYQLQAFFEKHQLDYDNETIIRREIRTSGKSRAFINDTPVSLTILKQLGESLVSLLAQHQTLHLHDAQYHLFIIDTLAEHETLLQNYRLLFKDYQKNKRELKQLKENLARLQKDLDYMSFQLNELETAELQDENEQEVLEQELSQLNNVEAIQTNLAECYQLLEEHDFSVLTQINSVKTALANINTFMPEVSELYDRIESATIELQDISNEIQVLEQDVAMNPERTAEIDERLNMIYRLQKKHQVETIAELLVIQNDLAEKVSSIETSDEDLKILEEKIATQEKDLFKKANQISANRKTQIPVFEQKINGLLDAVGMKAATIKTKNEKSKTLSINGLDEIEILFAANKGTSHAVLRKVASGGELSRLMLCIQSLMADNMALPTLIFDEIDTGISGEVALKVGKMIQNLAENHQVVCITHLPQIASKGDSHYFVYKKFDGEKTISNIRQLTKKQRVEEIAKMLSGDDFSQKAIANAEELLLQ